MEQWIKKVVDAVWPLIYNQLEKLAKSTDNRFDDLALIAVNAAVIAWINSPDKEDN
jgi:hypothetical protein